MSIVGNIICVSSGGGIMGLAWWISGTFWCMTIIGIPVGKQCFKIGKLCIFPFGKYVLNPSSGNINLLLNLIWMCFTGLPLAVAEATIGIALYITIIGIPFGRQHLKIARLEIAPFGASLV